MADPITSRSRSHSLQLQALWWIFKNSYFWYRRCGSRSTQRSTVAILGNSRERRLLENSHDESHQVYTSVYNVCCEFLSYVLYHDVLGIWIATPRDTFVLRKTLPVTTSQICFESRTHVSQWTITTPVAQMLAQHPRL